MSVTTARWDLAKAPPKVKRALAAYAAIRERGCHYALSMMAWRCKDRDGYDGTAEPCEHVKKAVPDWKLL